MRKKVKIQGTILWRLHCTCTTEQLNEWMKNHVIAWKVKLISPDDHFDRVDSNAQTFVLWDDEGHTATAVGHLCVEVHPFSWRRLGHDVEVDLHRVTKAWAHVTRAFLTAVFMRCCDDTWQLTFSPARVTMSRGPYMKRPVTICWESSVNTASFTRWLAVTFCQEWKKCMSWYEQIYESLVLISWMTVSSKRLKEFRILWFTQVPWQWHLSKVFLARCLPLSWHESSCGATSLEVWKGWIQTLLCHRAPGCSSFHASWPTGDISVTHPQYL